MKTLLVVPSIREEGLKTFLRKWQRPDNGNCWNKILVIEDNEQKTFKLNEFDVEHYSHNEIYNLVMSTGLINPKTEGYTWDIFSRKDSAIRCFGFYWGWVNDFTTIFTLDDDCYPVETPSSFVKKHINNLTYVERWAAPIPNVQTRGFPYKNLGELAKPVGLSLGLWRGVADLDSVQTLSLMRLGEHANEYLRDFKPPEGTKLLNPYQFIPMCGMNLAFSSFLAPLMYFPPMGQGSPYSRFDDIWCGLVVQKICAHLRIPISFGDPHVLHSRASDPFTNLKKEAAGIEANEKYWKVIAEIPLTSHSITGCMADVAGSLLFRKDIDPYFYQWATGMQLWCRLFNR